jgi:cyclophilin family peptidyl-prolyl cis-trans isomerase
MALVTAMFLIGALQGAPPSLNGADSALIGRVLLAEDRRDSTDRALREALRHADARVQLLARRALGRIRDPLFVARDSLPPVAPAPVWPEPEWKGRYRALTPRSSCGELGVAMWDTVWPVAQRAVVLAGARCARDTSLTRALSPWFVGLFPPPPLRAAAPPMDRWRVVATAVEHFPLAFAPRASPPGRNPQVLSYEGFNTDAQPLLRRAVARAARAHADTATLSVLSRDSDPNVREAAIEGLRAVAAHAADSIYLRAIDATEPQVVRAAAIALKGSTDPTAAPRAIVAWERWVAKQHASARDARVALLAVAGRPATDDRPPPVRVSLPPDAVALALGAELRVRVTLDALSGGRSFDVRLRGDVAPMMAGRIAQLVREGYYDGMTWHRVEHDFVIQGGSPTSNEYDGYRDFLRDELGTLPHPRGTVGMSTRGHDTGDAQWFVNLRDNARLMRDYTVFAEVVSGMDVVDWIIEGDRIATMRVVSGR